MLLNDINGKLSAKRLIGVIGSMASISAMLLQKYIAVSDTLILGMAGIFAALLTSSVLEKTK